MNDTIDFYQTYIERGAHMNTLVNLILDSAELNYRQNDLHIVDDSSILAFIKAYRPMQYRERLDELQDALVDKLVSEEEDDEAV